MEIKEIKRIIYDSVCNIQELSGRNSTPNFCDTVVPIGDFEGFDSLNAVEVTAELSGKLGCNITGNPFVSGTKSLTIEQIAENILNKISKKEN